MDIGNLRKDANIYIMEHNGKLTCAVNIEKLRESNIVSCKWNTIVQHAKRAFQEVQGYELSPQLK
jgi:hypothetical protein